MTKRLKKLYAICFLAVLSLVFAVTSVCFLNSAKAELGMIGSLEETYAVGQTAEIPSAFFIVGGKEYDAYSVVYTPDGVGYKTDSIALDVGGNYTVTYMAEINGKLYQESKEFEVKQQKFYATGSKSQISYETVADNTGAQRTGVKVSLARGERFVVSEVVSISQNMTYSDPLIDLHLLPLTKGSSDAKKFYIVIEDAFDSSNFIEYRVKLEDGTQQWTYTDARTPNQMWLGLQYYINQDDPLEPVAHYNAAAGFPMGINGGGWWNGKGYSTNMYLFYNPETNGLYNSSLPVALFGTKYFASNPWSGFSSDFVKISVYADEYIADTCNFIVTKVGDKSLQVGEFTDSEGPEITLDKGELDIDNMPLAVVGQSYSVMDAVANDLYSGNDMRLSKRVYFNYARENGTYNAPSSEYAYEVDSIFGEFIPKKAGKYSIVYSSKDYFGNYTEKVVTVNAVNASDYTSDLFANFSGEVTACEVNNLISLAKLESLGGQKGNVSVDYAVTLGGNEVDIKGNLIDGYTFIPTKAGVYSVVITVKDTNGDKVVNAYDITVSKNTKDAFNTDATLPKYFIAGESYYLPSLLAIDKNSGEEVNASITYVDASGEHTYTGAPVSFSPDNEGKVTVKYTSGGNEKVYKVPVVSVKGIYGIEITEYFQGEDVTKSVDVSGVKLTAFKKDASATFIKKVSDYSFLLRMKVDSAKNEFTTLNVWLEDSQDKTQKVLLTVVKSSSDTRVLINGKESGSFLSNVFYNEGFFNLEYSNQTRRFSTGIGEETAIETYYSGEKFVGFTSGAVYATVELVGVSGQASVWVTQINSQKLSINTTADTMKPELHINGVYDDIILSAGEDVTVYSAQAIDVLSEIAAAYVSVTKDGNYVVSSGRVMKNLSLDKDYEFSVTETGTYVITYYVIDTAGKNTSYTCQVTVGNFNAPTITVDVEVISIKAGDELTLPTVSAVDYFGNKCTVFAYLIRPDYTTRSIKDAEKIIINEAGTYRIRYVTTDADGNSAFKEVIVRVWED